MKEIEELIVSYEQAIKLKELGFNEPTPHCYMHDRGEVYDLQLFHFFLGGSGYLAEVYEDEKKLRQFDDSFVQNESETYFDYNQDIRKLIARRYNGEEYMNDPKSFNMSMDSYTYEKLSYEELENLKMTLPNYNDGDFDFDVYRDVISAPSFSQAFKFFREKYNLHYAIHFQSNLYFIEICNSEKYFTKLGENYYSYKEAELECLKHLIEITNGFKNIQAN